MKDFDFADPCYPRQSIYISQNTERLCEIVQEKGQVIIYQKKNKKNGKPNEIKWTVLSEVRAFPQLLNLRTPKNNLFSPNFSYMINMDMKQKEFFITDCLSNDKASVTFKDENGDDKLQYLKIKNDFLSFDTT